MVGVHICTVLVNRAEQKENRPSGSEKNQTEERKKKKEEEGGGVTWETSKHSPRVFTRVFSGGCAGRSSEGEERSSEGSHGKAKVIHQANWPVLGRVVELNVNGAGCFLFAAAAHRWQEVCAWGGGAACTPIESL